MTASSADETDLNVSSVPVPLPPPRSEGKRTGERRGNIKWVDDVNGICCERFWPSIVDRTIVSGLYAAWGS